MKSKKFHCFFEQSGTFKNEFKKLGYKAYDYDILNDFDETDYVIDLFNEIEKAYDNRNSIFDDITKEDMIIAFFPCIRFTDQIQIWFQGNATGQRKWNDLDKLEYDLILQKERTELYNLVTKLAIICLKKEIPLIIENPYTGEHYLKKFWGIKAQIIDIDRTLNGDYYEKPTQYFFINCEPKDNFIFEPLEYVEKKTIKHQKNENELNRTVLRSMIHPQYASRFIRQYILDEKEVKLNERKVIKNN